jgi:hypothetical protein
MKIKNRIQSGGRGQKHYLQTAKYFLSKGIKLYIQCMMKQLCYFELSGLIIERCLVLNTLIVCYLLIGCSWLLEVQGPLAVPQWRYLPGQC